MKFTELTPMQQLKLAVAATDLDYRLNGFMAGRKREGVKFKKNVKRLLKHGIRFEHAMVNDNQNMNISVFEQPPFMSSPQPFNSGPSFAQIVFETDDDVIRMRLDTRSSEVENEMFDSFGIMGSICIKDDVLTSLKDINKMLNSMWAIMPGENIYEKILDEIIKAYGTVKLLTEEDLEAFNHIGTNLPIYGSLCNVITTYREYNEETGEAINLPKVSIDASEFSGIRIVELNEMGTTNLMYGIRCTYHENSDSEDGELRVVCTYNNNNDIVLGTATLDTKLEPEAFIKELTDKVYSMAMESKFKANLQTAADFFKDTIADATPFILERKSPFIR